MSFMGKVRTYDPTPEDVKSIRGATGSALQGQIPNALAPIGNYQSNADTQFFLQNLLQPYSDLFAAQRGSALAQAKESAGNLTGSGYNNILGSATAESLAGEQATLAGIMNALRSQEIQRGLAMRGQDIGWQSNLLNAILGFGSSGWGKQQSYQPGLLDSIGSLGGTVLGAFLGSRNRPGGPVGVQPGVAPASPDAYRPPDYRP